MSPRGGKTSRRPAATPAAAAAKTLPLPLALSLVLAAAVLLHLDALRAPFFADDYLFLDQARFRSLPAALLSPDPIGNFFRPVSRQLWFWCLGSATHESALAFHLANLALFLALLFLLYALVRHRLGAWPALVGTGFLALHHAADVPLLWASGSQDLLAVVGSLGAILLLMRGRRLAATVAMAAALLSKETVVLAPFVAALAARREREPWKATLWRAAPLFAVLAAWAALYFLTVGRRPAMALEVHVGAAGIPAAFVHLVQTAIGLEWPHDLASALVGPPLVLILVALAIVAGPGAFPARGGRGAAAAQRGTSAEARRAAIFVGLAWALLGAVPVIAVAAIWSAYYYLFALCGVALALAGFAAARPAWAGLLLVMGTGWAAHQTRELSEFATAPGPWTTQSHVSRHYLARGMNTARVYLDQLLEARPQLPRNSTLFFTGLPAQVAFQTADGPLLRWAYRDTSLRSYFLGQFRMAHARRGPVFFFQASNDRLRELVGRDSLERIGGGLLVSEELEAARDAQILAVMQAPGQLNLRYRLAWIQGALGDTAAMRASLRACSLPLDADPSPEGAAALERLALGDTASARSLALKAVLDHPLNSAAHGVLADLQLMRDDLFENAAVEAFAARVLAPDDALVWRRWGLVQYVRSRHLKARAALERYLALGGERARADAQVRQTLIEINRRLPGGELAQKELHKVTPDSP